MKRHLMFVATMMAAGALHAQASDTLSRFFTLEPSLSLTHRTNGMHYLRLQLSHHRNTPSGDDLTTSRTYDDDSYRTGNRDLHSTLTSAPTYRANSSSHYKARYLTFGLTWRSGKLDLEYQARSGAAGQ